MSATIASNEDSDRAFVLVDDHAPTAEAAMEALIEGARREWDMVLDESELSVDLFDRHWYKVDPDDDERFIQCTPRDPDRDSEWWIVEIPKWEYTYQEARRLADEDRSRSGGKT